MQKPQNEIRHANLWILVNNSCYQQKKIALVKRTGIYEPQKK